MNANTIFIPWGLWEPRPLQLVKKTPLSLYFSNGTAIGWIFCVMGLGFLLLLPLVRPDARLVSLWVLGIPGALFFLLGPIAAWGTAHLRIDLERGSYTSGKLQFVTWKRRSGLMSGITAVGISMKCIYLYHRELPLWIAELRFNDWSVAVTTRIPGTWALMSGLEGTYTAALSRKEEMLDLVRLIAMVSHAPLVYRSGGQEQTVDLQMLLPGAVTTAAPPRGFPKLPPDSRISVDHDVFAGEITLGTRITLPRRNTSREVVARLVIGAAAILGGFGVLLSSLLLQPEARPLAMVIAVFFIGAGMLGLVLVGFLASTDETIRSDSYSLLVYHRLEEGVLRSLSLPAAKITSIDLVSSARGHAKLVIRSGLLRASVGKGLASHELEWLRQAVLFMAGKRTRREAARPK